MTQAFREGDIVSVRAVVRSDYGSDTLTVRCENGSEYDNLRVVRDDVSLLVPRFQVGERVVGNVPVNGIEKEVEGEVVCADGEELWLKVDVPHLGGLRITVKAMNAKLAAPRMGSVRGLASTSPAAEPPASTALAEEKVEF